MKNSDNLNSSSGAISTARDFLYIVLLLASLIISGGIGFQAVLWVAMLVWACYTGFSSYWFISLIFAYIPATICIKIYDIAVSTEPFGDASVGYWKVIAVMFVCLAIYQKIVNPNKGVYFITPLLISLGMFMLLDINF